MLIKPVRYLTSKNVPKKIIVSVSFVVNKLHLITI